MNSTKLALLNILFLFTFQIFNAQSKTAIVQTRTVTYNGATDTCDYVPLLINTNHNVVVAGNNKLSANQYEAMMAAQTNNALNLWNNSFNPSNQKAFIVASKNDSGGNIITVGAVRTSTTNALDWLVIKQNSGGTIQWVYTYDGPGLYNDCATAVDVDMADNIYITGSSDGTLTCLTDYATVKLNPAGTQQWVQRYNFGNNLDVPTAITYNSTTDNVTVIGSSGTTFGNFEIATVLYEANTGALLSSSRVSNIGSSQDKPFSLVTDSLGNSYVVGTRFNGINYDGYLAKLDTSLNSVWQKTININGFDDALMGVDIDDSLNVYVTGKSFESATKFNLITIKYHANGNMAWYGQTENNPNIDVEGLKIKVKNFNEIFVGGNLLKSGNQDVVFFRYDNIGMLTIQKTFNGPANGKDQFMDMELENNKVYISARTFSAGLDYNIVINYEYRDQIITPTVTSVSNGNFSEGQLIIGFHKHCLKMSKINNKELLFGKLGDFVADTTCDRITTALDPGGAKRLDSREFEAQKIYFKLNEFDTIATSNLGDAVKIPMFYTKLLVTIPQTVSTIGASGTLAGLIPDIYSTGLNYLFSPTSPTFIPNDFHYATGQSNLHPTSSYSLAHINCEPAWDYTKGNSFVTVGVYDTGVAPTHSDVSQNIVNNIDYTGSSVPFANDIYFHGTSVAGIIGAASNNSIGIAGIAGGDAASTTTANTGIKMHNLKIYEFGTGLAPLNVIANAYINGATSFTNNAGPPLDIMNNSYGSRSLTTSPDLADAIDYLNKMGIAFVASRGNKSVNNAWNITEYSAPATMKKGKVMNVGASGTDGHYHLDGANGTNYSSMYDHDVDFIAPGAYANIISTESTMNPSTPVINPTTLPYVSFGGTSASAPHVSGVTALMMSYRNSPNPNWDNIVHEDCEAILKRSADDQSLTATYSETVGPDIRTGYGKINAGNALAALEPKHKIWHIDKAHNSFQWTSNTNTLSSGIRYWPGAPTTTIPAGTYSVDMVEVKWDHNFGSLFSNQNYVDSWALFKASNAFGPIISPSTVIPVHEQNYAELLSASCNTAQIKGYTYHLKSFIGSSGTYTVDYWIPYAPSSPHFNLGMTLYTLAGNTNVDELQANVDYFNLYPNPNNGNFILGFYSQRRTNGNLNIFDITGRSVLSEKRVVESGVNRYTLNLDNLPKGIYFVNLEIESNKNLTKKLILE
jgi:hypothetical protein